MAINYYGFQACHLLFLNSGRDYHLLPPTNFSLTVNLYEKNSRTTVVIVQKLNTLQEKYKACSCVQSQFVVILYFYETNIIKGDIHVALCMF